MNLEAWDKNGGIAIKAINSINTPTERFVHINVKDKEKWLKSQMESSGDEQIEKLKARMIETQIKKWVKADIKFIRQTLNIRMKGMVDMKSYKMENGLEVEIDRTYKFFDLWDGKGDGEEVLRSCAVWVGNDADGMPIIANFEIMEYDPETPEKSMIKVVDIW